MRQHVCDLQHDLHAVLGVLSVHRVATVEAISPLAPVSPKIPQATSETLRVLRRLPAFAFQGAMRHNDKPRFAASGGVSDEVEINE